MLETEAPCVQKWKKSDKSLDSVWKRSESLLTLETPSGPQPMQVNQFRNHIRPKRAPLQFLTDWFYIPILGVASQSELNSIKSYLTSFKEVTDSVKTRISEQDSYNAKLLQGIKEFKNQLKSMSAP